MSDEDKKEGLPNSEETKATELSDQALETVAGGRKAGERPKEYLVVKMENALITGVTLETK